MSLQFSLNRHIIGTKLKRNSFKTVSKPTVLKLFLNGSVSVSFPLCEQLNHFESSAAGGGVRVTVHGGQ